MTKRKLLLVAMSLCMVAIMVAGGTLAYLTDDDYAENVFTVGKVTVEQNEYDRYGSPFSQNQIVKPLVDTSDKYNDPNYIYKRVFVTNTGTVDAYVRTFIAIPLVNNNSTDENAANNWLHWNMYSDTDHTPGNGWYWGTSSASEYPPVTGGNWNSYQTTIDGKPYNVFVGTNINKLAPGATTISESMRGFFLDPSVDNEIDADGNLNYYYMLNGKKFDLGDISNLEIHVATQACQADGFKDAWEAFEKSFGTPAESDPFKGK